LGGDLRYQLLWSLLAETGVRLGEALSLQHQDLRAGRGSTAAIVARPHAHGLIPKSGYRRIYVSAGLDRLYSDYVWALCDRGAAAPTDDWDSAFIFCNTEREPRCAPLRPGSVHAHLRMRTRQLADLPSNPCSYGSARSGGRRTRLPRSIC
jgi:integrase